MEKRDIYDLILSIVTVFIFIFMSFFMSEFVFLATIPLILSFFLFFVIFRKGGRSFFSSVRFTTNLIMVVLIIFSIIKLRSFDILEESGEFFVIIVVLIVIGLILGVSISFSRWLFKV